MPSVKIHTKPPKGIPEADVGVLAGVLALSHTPQVTEVVSAIEMGVSTVVASVRFSPAEARAHAALLCRRADEAEAQAAAEEGSAT